MNVRKLTDGDSLVTSIALAGVFVLAVSAFSTVATANGVTLATYGGFISPETGLFLSSTLYVASIATAGMSGGLGAGVAIGLATAGF